MRVPVWTSTADFARLATMERQVANRLLGAFFSGNKTSWRGHTLEVQISHGRGGRSGIQYQVKVSSLPAHLQDRLKALQTSDEAVAKLSFGNEARFERAWKYEIIKDAVAHPKGSPGRKAEIAKLDGKSRLDWTGHQRRLTQSTLYKWIETYEAEGIHALAQRVRSDKGKKKVIISRTWSKTVPFSDDAKETIAEDVRQFVRGCIAKGLKPKLIRATAAIELRRLTKAWGFDVAEQSVVDRVFRIPQGLIAAEVRFKAVYRHNFDRKASEDNKPRIRRTIAGLAPMEIVVMDVHHINVMVLRENGSVASPKLLAFHDVATNRVFCEIVFFQDRGGVRNVHVIEAFKRMCQHPAYGVPQTLYADNGSEYGFAYYLEDALKLTCAVVPFSKESRKQVIRAKPYNAAAKVVEGFFRQMNQQYFRHIPGWIDDNRMNPKRRELGRPMPPYEAGLESFWKIVFKLLKTYEAMPQSGALKGKSPADTFRSHVEDGWAATVIDEQQFYMAFSKRETRSLEKHAFRYDGRLWTCPELDRCLEAKIVVLAPAYHGYNELSVETLQGRHIGWAKPDRQFSYLDQAGAVSSATRDKDRNKAIRDLERSVPDIDVLGKLIELGENAASVTPNAPAATISVDFDGSNDRAIVPSRSEKKTRQQHDEELRRENEERSAIFAKMNLLEGKAI